MFKLEDKDKDAKAAVLQSIMDWADSKAGDRLKKPGSAEISVTEMKPGGDDSAIDGKPEPDDDDMPMLSGADDAGGEPSEEDKAKIAELYHRYCK